MGKIWSRRKNDLLTQEFIRRCWLFFVAAADEEERIFYICSKLDQQINGSAVIVCRNDKSSLKIADRLCSYFGLQNACYSCKDNDPFFMAEVVSIRHPKLPVIIISTVPEIEFLLEEPFRWYGFKDLGVGSVVRADPATRECIQVG